MKEDINHLLQIMAQLRDPEVGCPWDLEQDFATIAPHTIEEAYEVAEAINHSNMVALREELGDLLFQVVFHAQMAHESGKFHFFDVVATISDKMVRRHPHVFGDAKINGADFSGGNLDGTDFFFSELRSNFTGASLLGANLFGADL